jgi:beta-glucanase (GH16 family)
VKKLRLILIINLFLVACGEPGKDVTTPTNLVVNATVSTDGSGRVEVMASVDNAAFLKFFFGEVTNEIPAVQEFKSIAYTYKKSGTYTITVQAHATEADFISHSVDITVNIFVWIPATGYSTPTSYPGMNSIWSDEFDGPAIDENKWTFEIGDGCPSVCGWGNNELEYYKKENASVNNGNLTIEAKSELAGTKAYTSARMITRDNFNFKYGRVDARAALPQGQGIWPAIWMLGSNIGTVGWPKCGEIDIMEMIGGAGREKTVHGTAHWDNGGSYASFGKFYSLSSGIFYDQFHVFTVLWDENKIQWYVDDVMFNEIDITQSGLSEFRENFFLILNLAVGGNWPGSPDSQTKFPQRLIVDYVRVFQNQ